MQDLREKTSKDIKVRTANKSKNYFHGSGVTWLKATIEEKAEGQNNFPGSELIKPGKTCNFQFDKYSFNTGIPEVHEFVATKLDTILKSNTTILSIDGYNPPKEDSKYQSNDPDVIPGAFHVTFIRTPSFE